MGRTVPAPNIDVDSSWRTGRFARAPARVIYMNDYATMQDGYATMQNGYATMQTELVA